ncbi:MAG: hypothetical protein EOO13_16855 [Chitinophagaceae bacterium]|nr:MAG: hypothetical protein EOO13_16855 [Chitinophagaceae bacterium]
MSRFYRLPFKQGGRVLTQETLEAHNDFKAADNTYYLWGKDIISFKRGLVTMKAAQVDEKMNVEQTAKIYFKVEYDYLLISCELDTNSTYLSWDVYRTLRAMMRRGEFDFTAYYWPACFDEATGRSKFVRVFNDRQGFDIKLKNGFKGLFRPDDPFPSIDERNKVLERASVKPTTQTVVELGNGIGYCLAYTSIRFYESQHYPFLIPYLFTANADLKTVKSFEHFVFNETDIDNLELSPEQKELNESCYAMKNIAHLQRWTGIYTTEKAKDVEEKNLANKHEIHQLWNKAWPLLVAQGFTHYWFTYGIRNVQKRPKKQSMKLATFSVEVPRLSFLLTDKGDYYELFLRFKIKGKLFCFDDDGQALPMVYSQNQSQVWYLLEAAIDGDLVNFFSEFNFKIQVPKAYYGAHFEKHVMALEKFYEVIVR